MAVSLLGKRFSGLKRTHIYACTSKSYTQLTNKWEIGQTLRTIKLVPSPCCTVKKNVSGLPRGDIRFHFVRKIHLTDDSWLYVCIIWVMLFTIVYTKKKQQRNCNCRFNPFVLCKTCIKNSNEQLYIFCIFPFSPHSSNRYGSWFMGFEPISARAL